MWLYLDTYFLEFYFSKTFLPVTFLHEFKSLPNHSVYNLKILFKVEGHNQPSDGRFLWVRWPHRWINKLFKLVYLINCVWVYVCISVIWGVGIFSILFIYQLINIINCSWINIWINEWIIDYFCFQIPLQVPSFSSPLSWSIQVKLNCLSILPLASYLDFER